MRRSYVSRLTLLASALSPLVYGSPLLQHTVEQISQSEVDVDLAAQLNRRQGSLKKRDFLAVTGVQGFGTQPRLEIRQLEQNEDQYNIYILGLRKFQQVDQGQTASYFAIAGIHGRPFQAWDNVDSPYGFDNTGYCLHTSNLFLPWHRPYVALFEQELYKHIVDAVNEFPAGRVRQRYAAAAMTWRQPYWDWAAEPPDGQSSLPASLMTPTINVTLPNGTTTINNPLFMYKFDPPGGNAFYYEIWKDWLHTYRSPTNLTLEAMSQNDQTADSLNNNRQAYMSSLYTLFSQYNNFTQFSNQMWTKDTGPGGYDSLESLHDSIHTTTGQNNGHMTYFEFAAYDPIFMLHHAMIDRCFALWQALHPDSYVEPMNAIEQTFTVEVGELQDANSPLMPFRSANGSFWTSSQVVSTSTFGYTYSELLNNADTSSITAAINQLYGGNNDGDQNNDNSHRRSRDISDTIEDEATKEDELIIRSESAATSFRYVANIKAPKCTIHGSYAVYVFIGDVASEDTSTWSTAITLAGTFGVFATLGATNAQAELGMSTPISRSQVLITGTVPLTAELAKHAASGDLESLQPDIVEQYLTQNLHWRVATYDGTTIVADELDGLSVSVISAVVQPAASNDQFPQYSDFRALSASTQSKGGGA